MKSKPNHQHETDLPKLAAPALRALAATGIKRLDQLTKFSEAEIKKLHGMGPNALGKLHEALAERGMSFRKTKEKQSMDRTIRTQLDNIYSEDGQLQNKAYMVLMEETEGPVDWAYEAWDELIAGLTQKDNHVRAITAQLLTNLAKSDPKGRIFKDFDKLLAVTKDERFVTARHCLQSLWRIGLAGKKQTQLVMNGLEKRFKECANEKNGTLIRYDIIVDLHNLYDAVKDEVIKEKALELVEIEKDSKYKKKYATVWRK